jgi:hypothetical protein
MTVGRKFEQPRATKSYGTVTCRSSKPRADVKYLVGSRHRTQSEASSGPPADKQAKKSDDNCNAAVRDGFTAYASTAQITSGGRTLWLANNLSVGNDLTFRAGKAKNLGSCRPSSCPCFVCCDSSSVVMGPSRTLLSAFNSLPSNENENDPFGLLRPTVLGGGVPAVDWLARTPGLRPSRHGRPLAGANGFAGSGLGGRK